MKRFSFIIAALAVMVAFAACASSGSSSAAAKTMYKAGTYEGSSDGYHGLVKVAVTVTEKAITKIQILEQADTEGIGTVAFEELTESIIKANSTDVDVVSGASNSSEGFIEAVNNALSKAKAE